MRITKYGVELDNNKKNILVKEGGCNYPSTSEALTSPYAILNMLNFVFRANRQAEEHVYLLAFNTKCKLLGVFEVSHGTADQSLVNPREMFVRLFLCGATQFAIAHNHPSGDCTPSKSDNEVTNRVKDAAKLMGITFLDHIVIGSGSNYYSFAENGNIKS